MKKLAIAGLCATIIITGVFIYWVGTAEPHEQFITTPPLGDSSHVLIAAGTVDGHFGWLQVPRPLDI
jgi:hypothetical protein